MSSYVIDIDPSDVDTDGVFAAITGAGPWDSVDFNVGNPPDGLAHQLSFIASAAVSTLVFTITGTDADGNSISEDVTGVDNLTPVETSKYFKTITGLSADATLGVNTLAVGWVDEVATQLYKLNWRENVAAGLFHVDVTGTIALDVQFFIPDTERYSETSLIPIVVDIDLAGETADVTAYIEEVGYKAFRIVVNSYTDTAEVQVYTSQP